MSQTPLFVAGLARSGTTALTHLLGEHSEIALAMERFKKLWLRQDFTLSRDMLARERILDFSDGYTNIVPADGPHWVEYYDRMGAKWDRARYVGDKMTRVRIQRIWATMEDARFVCVVRDVESVAHSWQSRAEDPGVRAWRSEADAVAAVRQWNTSMRRVRRAARQRPDQALVVEHGRFFGDPEAASLRALLARLGLEPEPAILARFDELHRHYVDEVATKPRTLSPEHRALLDDTADRRAWRQVRRLAL